MKDSRPEACIACDKPVAATAARCPHCGATLRETRGLADAKVTSDEAAALLLMHEQREERAPSDGVFGQLVLPDPATEGGARATELALTAMAAPVIIGGLAFLLWPRFYERIRRASPVATQLFIALAGGSVFFKLLGLAAGGTKWRLAVAGASALAMLARDVVRHRASTAVRRRLTRAIEDGDKEAQTPLLPRAVATVVEKPSAGRIELIEVQRSEPRSDGDDEPSILK